SSPIAPRFRICHLCCPFVLLPSNLWLLHLPLRLHLPRRLHPPLRLHPPRRLHLTRRPHPPRHLHPRPPPPGPRSSKKPSSVMIYISFSYQLISLARLMPR